MRSATRLLVLALAVLATAGLLASSSGAFADGPVAVEYGKKAKKKKKKAIKKATKAVRDGQYIGHRGGDVPDLEDWTLCKNGKYEIRSTGYYDGLTGVSKGKRWRIANAVLTKKGFWAIIKGQGGLSVAIAKSGKQWKVGLEAFDEPYDFGKAERTNAKQRCKTL